MPSPRETLFFLRICAGLLLDRLWNHEEPDVVTDSAHTAFTLYHTDRDNLPAALRGANHAESLARKGFGDDLDYCFRVETHSVLPYYSENRLRRYEELAAA